MSLNSSKRKGRLNPNSNKLGKSKFYPPEKNMPSDGIYGNSKLMYTAASLVGCVVQIQVQNGAIFEGVLRTFSQQLDIVLEMAHKVNLKSSPAKGISPTVSNLIASYPFEGGIFDKLVFKLSDIIMMVARTVDMDFAVKDNFTDSAISKFNGQVKERELEPWEDTISDSEGTVGFSIEDDEETNGWDANDMFRTNAEKYGVKSSYDNSLLDYTVPLMKKDTEEYKLQEAKALKIAQEIETNNLYQSRIQLENGDEEDRFSAVIRTDDHVPSKYVLPHKRHNASGLKSQLTPPSLSEPSSISKPCMMSSNSGTILNQNLPYSSSLPVFSESSLPPSSSGCTPNVIVTSMPKTEATVKSTVEDALLENESVVDCTNSENSLAPSKIPVMYTQTLPPRIEKKRETEKKFSKHKGRIDEIEEFKKFSSNFKLTDEKDIHETKEMTKSMAIDSLASKIEKTKMINKDEDKCTTKVVKFSTLNPNAKEFVFNPNAKAFTPRSMPSVTPPIPVAAPPPLSIQEQNSLIAVPPSQMIPSLPQPIFTAMAPQYVMQAAPVSVAITPSFTAAASVPQPPPRFRKASGQPLMAPSGIPSSSQITVQYSSPPGVIHTSAPTQPAVGYPQMNFVVGPRLMSPQSMAVIPTSHSVSYCDTSHLPTHLIMSAHPGSSHAAATTPHTLQQGQHSNHHPPQCQTPVIHPSPSPVHQGPPAPSHSQPTTPTAVIYPGQHPLQAAGHHSHSSHPMHPGAFSAGPPQQVVLMQQQQGHQVHHSHHMHPLHSQAQGSHMGGPTHILSQMAIIPTSAAMTSVPTSYIQHP